MINGLARQCAHDGRSANCTAALQEWATRKAAQVLAECRATYPRHEAYGVPAPIARIAANEDGTLYNPDDRWVVQALRQQGYRATYDHDADAYMLHW